MRQALAVVVLATFAAGCTAEGASASNFTLEPARIGWYAGDEAVFTLALQPSLTRASPSFAIDRRFAIEEIRLVEQGFKFGGDHKTRDPDSVSLRLYREGEMVDDVVLTETNSTVDIHLKLPEKLRDSEYVLEMKLFKVGWVKSDAFRVDRT